MSSPADELMALIDNLATRDGTTGHLTTACRCVSSLASRCSAAEIEAFMRSGGTSALTSLLKSRDEEVVDAAAAALADLSAPASRRPQERVFELQGLCVRVRELEFSESGTQRGRCGRCRRVLPCRRAYLTKVAVAGTAHNVWTAAIVLAQWMSRSKAFAAHLAPTSGLLELGSGLGVPGLLAAKMGWKVTLSDFVPHVIDNLEASISLNDVGACARAVRLNWAEEAGVLGPCSNDLWYAGKCPGGAHGGSDAVDGKHYLELEDDEQFEVIIGADICYEEDHPNLLDKVLRRRLSPEGRVFFLYAVRFPELHDALLERLHGFCSEVSSESVDSAEVRNATAPTRHHLGPKH